MLILLIVVTLIVLIVYLFLHQPSFGKLPAGERLKRIEQSPNYKNGQFQNLIPTNAGPDGVSYFTLFKEFFKTHENSTPVHELQCIRRNLKEPPATSEAVFTWFGHSSYLIQVAGKNILVDPVFSQRTSPVQYAGSKAFAGTCIYSVQDLPAIDYVILTHDHYDHCDFDTIKQLGNQPAQYITPLGVGSHLEHWGINSNKITELDWWNTTYAIDGIKLTLAPGRHFTGRGFTRNRTLWGGYAMEVNNQKIYLGGDSGYGPHFKQIGDRLGPFDLVILECGQYNAYWPNIHMMPEETVQAARELQATKLWPVHWAKFRLAMHPWNEPAERAVAKANELQVPVATPQIGEAFSVNTPFNASYWWR